MTDIVWLDRQALLLLHGESIADHGGLTGLRDEGLFDSALARPRNLHAYENVTNIHELAACYAVALAKNHPFSDGNKRIAFIAAVLFSALNDRHLVADQAQAARATFGVADGTVDQPEFAAWLAIRFQPKP